MIYTNYSLSQLKLILLRQIQLTDQTHDHKFKSRDRIKTQVFQILFNRNDLKVIHQLKYLKTNKVEVSKFQIKVIIKPYHKEYKHQILTKL